MRGLLDAITECIDQMLLQKWATKNRVQITRSLELTAPPGYRFSTGEHSLVFSSAADAIAKLQTITFQACPRGP